MPGTIPEDTVVNKIDKVLVLVKFLFWREETDDKPTSV